MLKYMSVCFHAPKLRSLISTIDLVLYCVYLINKMHNILFVSCQFPVKKIMKIITAIGIYHLKPSSNLTIIISLINPKLLIHL